MNELIRYFAKKFTFLLKFLFLGSIIMVNLHLRTEGNKMGKKGWLVTFSGTGLNLALGTLYAWSVFGKQFTEAIDKGGFGWSKTAAAMPYSIAIGVFALMMIPAGRLQDKLGPGIIATIGAILMAAGMIVTSFSTPRHALPALIGFGILAGTGIGVGYA